MSTTDQLEFSPDAQKKAISQYAIHHDISIDERYIYVDEGISGRRAEKRPAFMKMIREAKEKPKPYDVILVHKFDRFARNREDSVVYKSLLKQKCGIRVISVSEQLEDDKFSIILESMLEAMAEYYSLNLADEVKKGMSEKARRGGMQTRPPLGYEYNNGKVEVNNKEREIVKYIYRLFAEEEATYVDIAKSLNAMGYRTKNKGLFQSKSIKYILENPFYIGVVRWNRHNRKGSLRDESEWIIAKGDHEHLISDDQYKKVYERIVKLKVTTPSVHQSQFSHTLSGMIRCAHCGGTMVYKNNGGKYTYFRCRKSANGACDHKKMIRADRLERLILDQLCHDFHHWLIDVKKRGQGYAEPFDQLSKQLVRMGYKHDNIKRAYIEGIDSIDEYRVNKKHLIEEEQQLKKQMNACKPSDTSTNRIVVYDLLGNKRKYPKELGAIYRSFINCIYVDTHKFTITMDYYN